MGLSRNSEPGYNNQVMPSTPLSLSPGLATAGLALVGNIVSNWTDSPGRLGGIPNGNSDVIREIQSQAGNSVGLQQLLRKYPGYSQYIAPLLDNAMQNDQVQAKQKAEQNQANTQNAGKQDALNHIAQYGVGDGKNLPYIMNKFGITQNDISNALNNNQGFQKQGVMPGQTVTYNGQQYPIQDGMVNINGIGIDAKAIQDGKVSIDDVMQNWAASPANPNRSLGVQAPMQAGQNTQQAADTRQGTIYANGNQPVSMANSPTATPGTPQDYINQLLASVGQGQSQQEDATRQQFQVAQPAIQNAIQAALVRQSGGGRGGLDTGGAISAGLQQSAKNNVDLNTALADVAKYYSTLKQNALGQALTGSLNMAQLGQQNQQFGQTLAANNAQNLNQTELQKYLAQLQSQQQNKTLQQSADEFAKSFGLQQQNQDWTQNQANVNRQNQLQDYAMQGNLAKELANMQPKVPEYSYWLNPLAQGLGQYFGSRKTGGTV